MLLGRWRDSVLGGVEMKAAALYATGVRKARGPSSPSARHPVLLLLMSGFLLIHVALFLWLPWSLKARALALLLLGLLISPEDSRSFSASPRNGHG